MSPAVLDATISLLGDLLIAGLILLAVKRGAVPPELGAAALGFLFRAVALPPLSRNRLAAVVIGWLRSHREHSIDDTP